MQLCTRTGLHRCEPWATTWAAEPSWAASAVNPQLAQHWQSRKTCGSSAVRAVPHTHTLCWDNTGLRDCQQELGTGSEGRWEAGGAWRVSQCCDPPHRLGPSRVLVRCSLGRHEGHGRQGTPACATDLLDELVADHLTPGASELRRRFFGQCWRQLRRRPSQTQEGVWTHGNRSPAF